MKDQSKTKQVLIRELVSLRQKIAGFEQTETERMQVVGERQIYYQYLEQF